MLTCLVFPSVLRRLRDRSAASGVIQKEVGYLSTDTYVPDIVLEARLSLVHLPIGCPKSQKAKKSNPKCNRSIGTVGGEVNYRCTVGIIV